MLLVSNMSVDCYEFTEWKAVVEETLKRGKFLSMKVNKLRHIELKEFLFLPIFGEQGIITTLQMRLLSSSSFCSYEQSKLERITETQKSITRTV